MTLSSASTSLLDSIPLELFPEIEGMEEDERIAFAGKIIEAAEYHYVQKISAAKTALVHELLSIGPALTLTVLSAAEAVEKKSPSPLYENAAFLNPFMSLLTLRIAYILYSDMKLLQEEQKHVEKIKRIFQRRQDPAILHLLGLEIEGMDPVYLQEGQKKAERDYSVPSLYTGLKPERIKKALTDKSSDQEKSETRLRKIWDEAVHAIVDAVSVPFKLKGIFTSYAKGWKTLSLQVSRKFLETQSLQGVGGGNIGGLEKSPSQPKVQTDDIQSEEPPPFDNVYLAEEEDVEFLVENERRLASELARIEKSAEKNRGQLRRSSEAFPMETAFVIGELGMALVSGLTGNWTKMAMSGFAGWMAIRPGQVLADRHVEMFRMLGSDRSKIADIRREKRENAQNLLNAEKGASDSVEEPSLEVQK